MDTRTFKKSLYQELSQVTKALSNPHRLEILDLLAQGSFPVAYIAEQTKLPVANASQHLQVLKKSGLVKTQREGKYMYYELAGQHVFDTWCALRKLGFTQNEEISKLLNDYRNRRNSLKTISSDELNEMMSRQEIYVIDVRPEEEYEKGHIEDAVSYPQQELSERIKDLPEDREIVAYCRGPLCLMADEAVKYLQKEGFEAARLEDGYADWAASGKAVANTKETNEQKSTNKA
ncbi:transcriptional regulator, ArsR family [Fodinibius roseus]|uniref:Transcriptional regulator, ArsR family n=1 Tax=Fodinibius roseus TaxID=1194090 RepID=A0A1M5G0W8_9BACT|nr:metalloregulator ArsR/SmtB family transcription factor [Fodinibius roseus]SHF97440.1 transcriptional regulator, ArsR family [Fodinibius roseus]